MFVQIFMNKQIYVLNVSTYFTLYLYLLSIRIRYMLWQYSTKIRSTTLAQRQQLLYVIIIIIIIKGIYKRIEQGGSKLGSADPQGDTRE